MVLERKYREMAKALHQEFPAVDAHLDLAGELYFRKQNGEENPLRDHYLEPLLCVSPFSSPESGRETISDPVCSVPAVPASAPLQPGNASNKAKTGRIQPNFLKCIRLIRISPYLLSHFKFF